MYAFTEESRSRIASKRFVRKRSPARSGATPSGPHRGVADQCWPYRDAEKLPIGEIARRLGRAEATIKAYLWDATGERRARSNSATKACAAAAGHPAARATAGDAYAYCKHYDAGAIQTKWTRERVRKAMLAWRDRHGRLPIS